MTDGYKGDPYVRTCARAHVCTCARVHVCMCACVHVCMCACAHVCKYNKINDFSISDDWSFDDKMSEGYGCQVHSFDPR